MSRKPVPYSTNLSRPTSNQQQSPNTPVSSYGNRFPSSQYPQETYPPPNPPGSHQPAQTPQARSRSSTQTSPQRQPTTGGGLGPSAYHTSRPSNGSITANIKQLPSPPPPQHQTLYSRPPSSGGVSAGRGTSSSSNTYSAPPLPTNNPSLNTPINQQQPTQSPFTTPVSAPVRARPFQILLINPTCNRHVTDSALSSIRARLPPNVELTGYTVPAPAPTAIETATDAVLSADACIRSLSVFAAANHETVQNFDGFLVLDGDYARHPLVDALREMFDVPVVGVTEASLYTARMLGGRFGIIATSRRGRVLSDDSVSTLGLKHWDVGAESCGLGSWEMESASRSREEVAKRVGAAAQRLVVKGADVVVLASIPAMAGAGTGTSAMGDVVMRAAKDAVRDEDGRRLVNIVEGVEAGVWMLCGLCGMGCPTSKKGIFASVMEARRARGQDWL